MFVCVVSLSHMLYVKCLCVLSRYLICYMLNVCVCCLVISYVYMLSQCYMFVCVVSLSHMLYVKCLCVVSLSHMLYVKCLCVLSRYLICYMLNVCVCCLVISYVIC